MLPSSNKCSSNGWLKFSVIVFMLLCNTVFLGLKTPKGMQYQTNFFPFTKEGKRFLSFFSFLSEPKKHKHEHDETPISKQQGHVQWGHVLFFIITSIFMEI